jgi:hypothetical protein
MNVPRKTYGPNQDRAEVVLFVITGGVLTLPRREPLVRFLRNVVVLRRQWLDVQVRLAVA